MPPERRTGTPASGGTANPCAPSGSQWSTTGFPGAGRARWCLPVELPLAITPVAQRAHEEQARRQEVTRACQRGLGGGRHPAWQSPAPAAPR